MKEETDSQSPLTRRVLVLLDNLFFAAKINQAAAQAGVQTLQAKSAEQALELARTEAPALMLVDLEAFNDAPLHLIAQLKADEQTRAIPIIGFVSHVNVELQERARQAGCDRVMARSAFDRNLFALLSQLS